MNAPAEQMDPARNDVERIVNAAHDALTDEMVTRLAATWGDAITMIDQANRAGIGRALPALARLVENGDLERIAQLARVYSSAQDALTDEMVGRMAETIGNGLLLLDRASRGGADRVITMLESLNASGALERLAATLPQLLERLGMVQSLLQAVDDAAAASRAAQPSTGGFGGLWRLLRDPESQDTLRFLLDVGKKLRQGALGAT
ncbi:MAG TPA: DUF1641 domain-containing protein [Casimicrobiaceae bacterium]|nr:DUF1641 domain-containing protein [Casimicrobiaceae bacterium]